MAELTSKIADIECHPLLMEDGECSLAQKAAPLLSDGETCAADSFVRADGTRFVLNGDPFFMSGGALLDDATLWDPKKPVPENASIEARDYAFTAVGGLSTVRLSVKMDYFMDEKCEPRREGFEFLDEQLQYAKANNLHVVIDMHVPYGGAVQDFQRNSLSMSFWASQELKDCFVKGWGEIAKKYAGNCLIAGFELMNEPSGMSRDFWKLMDGTIAAIRATDEHHLLILQSAYDWQSREIADGNIAFSAHYYSPMTFTLQNVYWDRRFDTDKPVEYPGMIKGNDGVDRMFDRSKIAGDVEQLARISARRNIPVIMGEYAASTGASEKSVGTWVSDVTNAVIEKGLAGYLYWRQVEPGIEDLSTAKEGHMTIINKGPYFSAGQFFGIRPWFAKIDPDFDAKAFYDSLKEPAEFTVPECSSVPEK